MNITTCSACDAVYTTQVACPVCGGAGRAGEQRRDSSTPFRRKSQKRRSKHELAFIAWLKRLAPNASAYVEEYRFHDVRQWRFDFAWPDAMLAVEIEGGIWSQGRHTRGFGYVADCEKYNAAVLAGWRVLRFTSEHIKNEPAAMIEQVMQALDATRQERAA